MSPAILSWNRLFAFVTFAFQNVGVHLSLLYLSLRKWSQLWTTFEKIELELKPQNDDYLRLRRLSYFSFATVFLPVN